VNITTVGIIGASGQVGTEVCLFLKTYPGVRVIAIVRTPVSGSILRRCGIEVRVGTFAAPEQSIRLVGDCDIVIDFSAISTGEVAQICAHYAKNITAALQYSPSWARYVFISTINAFGIGDDFNRAKNYLMPHSVYAYTKRYAERRALRLGKRQGKQTFVFRLGHVHGLLQRVSQETAELVRGSYTEFEYPDTPSYTIFCHTIAEAIVNVAASKEAPGIYTLVSEPAWSWKEVLQYYAPPGCHIKITLRPTEQTRWRTRVANRLERAALRLGFRYQETLRANLLHRIPRLELNIRGRFYRYKAQQQIREWQDQFIYRPPLVHEGIFPGKRLASASDSRVTMAEKTAEVRTMLNRLSSDVGPWTRTYSTLKLPSADTAPLRQHGPPNRSHLGAHDNHAAGQGLCQDHLD
jgi:nucleoside-diphosphate-sugar epimerase